MMVPDEGDVEPHVEVSALDEDQGLRRFVVHSKSRWRIRSEPSLSATTLGTLASGTVAVGYFVADDGQRQQATSSWIFVVRFEAENHYLAPEYYGGDPPQRAMYCYRRNGDGYGLYEMGVESIEGRQSLVATSSRHTEDPSFTNQLLGVADEIANFLTKFSPFEETMFGATEYLESPKRASDLFAQKEEERLRKAARRIGQAATVLMQRSCTKDLSTASSGMPVDLRKPLLRLSESLLAADVKQATGSMNEGSLEKFIRVCTRIDSKGKRKSLSRELQQEIVSFSQKYGQAFEHHCRAARSADASVVSSSDKDAAPVGWMQMIPTKDCDASLPMPCLQAPPSPPSFNKMKESILSPRHRSESMSTVATESSPLLGISPSPPGVQFDDDSLALA